MAKTSYRIADLVPLEIAVAEDVISAVKGKIRRFLDKGKQAEDAMRSGDLQRPLVMMIGDVPLVVDGNSTVMALKELGMNDILRDGGKGNVTPDRRSAAVDNVAAGLRGFENIPIVSNKDERRKLTVRLRQGETAIDVVNDWRKQRK